MDHVEVTHYLDKSWAQTLAKVVRGTDRSLLNSAMLDTVEQKHLKSIFLDISEALQEVGIQEICQLCCLSIDLTKNHCLPYHANAWLME